MSKEITIKIPDWVDPKTQITVLAGVELIARMPNGKNGVLQHKIKRCNYCGLCCMEAAGDYPPFGTVDGERCEKLKWSEGDQGYVCTAGLAKPYCCLLDPNENEYPDCSIKYDKTV